jgi:hypothetical protein
VAHGVITLTIAGAKRRYAARTQAGRTEALRPRYTEATGMTWQWRPLTASQAARVVWAD